MATLAIQQILRKVNKVSRYGTKGIVTYALVGGDIARGWGTFEVGEEVYTYFEDKYNRVGMKKIDK